MAAASPDHKTPDIRDLFRQLADTNTINQEQTLLTVYNRLKLALYTSISPIVLSPDLVNAVVSDTIYTLWIHRAQVARLENPGAWLFRCAKRKALNIRRGEKRYTQTIHRYWLWEGKNIREEREEELKTIIARAIDKLPTQQQQVIILKHELGMNRKEIADTCGLSVHTVRNHLAAAYRSLRMYLKPVLKALYKSQ